MSLHNSEQITTGAKGKGFLKTLIETNVTRKLIPKGMSWFGCMGGLSLLAFLIQLTTGTFLLFYFSPSTKESAISSIQRVIHTVPYGWLVLRLHAAGSHIMICMVFSHMLRIFFKEIYRHPRELHWVSGSCLLILTLLMCYTGSMLSVQNIYSNSVARLLPVYLLHIAATPLAMSLFMGMHFFMVKKTGIHEPL
ncbi:MAG: petB 2 [Candidatus Brocadiaceae bacterium]|nr:petB 2 [Candidatus Brocadiaceae bacterium]